MVTFEHLEKTETISADGAQSETDWDGALTPPVCPQHIILNSVELLPVSGRFPLDHFLVIAFTVAANCTV